MNERFFDSGDGLIIIPPKVKIQKDSSNCLSFDAAPSQRETDENGFLHVGASHITKATVNPYYGREIPGWQEAGLDPEAIYYGLRDPEELQASLETWAGLPLHIEHHIDSCLLYTSDAADE